jgi:hypothetical protein
MPSEPEDTEACLKAEELKDLGAYFAPSLEGVDAICDRVRQPVKDPSKFDYSMVCRGEGFSVEVTTNVTIEASDRFSAAIESHSRSAGETVRVVAQVKAKRSGPCKPEPATPAPAPAEKPAAPKPAAP